MFHLLVLLVQVTFETIHLRVNFLSTPLVLLFAVRRILIGAVYTLDYNR